MVNQGSRESETDINVRDPLQFQENCCLCICSLYPPDAADGTVENIPPAHQRKCNFSN